SFWPRKRAPSKCSCTDWLSEKRVRASRTLYAPRGGRVVSRSSEKPSLVAQPQGRAEWKLHANDLTNLMETIAGVEWCVDGNLSSANPHAVANGRTEKFAIHDRSGHRAFTARADLALLRTEDELCSRIDVGFRGNRQSNAFADDVGALCSRADELAR